MFMSEERKNFDYYYGTEADQYSFIRFPKELITNSYYNDLSDSAKILFGIFLDRMSLSRKNGWLDDENKVYIIYSNAEIAEVLNCSKDKVIKVIKELLNYKLIHRIKQGQGKPSIYYVLNIYKEKLQEQSQNSTTAYTIEDNINDPQILDTFENIKEKSAANNNLNDINNMYFQKNNEYLNGEDCSNDWLERTNSRSQENRIQEIVKVEFIKSEKPNLRSQENRIQEVEKSDTSNTNISNINLNNTNLSNNQSIHQSKSMIDAIDGIDLLSFEKSLRDNICYSDLLRFYENETDNIGLVNSIINLSLDVVATRGSIVPIGKKIYPKEFLCQKLLTLNYEKIVWLVDNIKILGKSSKIKNIKAYIQTMIVNTAINYGTEYQNYFNSTYFGG